VDVKVEDGLARGLADVNADVEAVGVVAAHQEVPGAVDGCRDRCLLLLAGVEPGRDVPPRDDQEVALADREACAGHEPPPFGSVRRSARGAVARGDRRVGGFVCHDLA
jgi:hypothetical protein